jgi:hypothetical protein
MAHRAFGGLWDRAMDPRRVLPPFADVARWYLEPDTWKRGLRTPNDLLRLWILAHVP